MNDEKPNQFAYLTQYEMRGDPINVKEYNGREYHIKNLAELRFSGIATATPAMISMLQDWMNKPKVLPYFNPEWKCHYCGSPQPIDQTHCKQCGAPRGFLIG